MIKIINKSADEENYADRQGAGEHLFTNLNSGRSRATVMGLFFGIISGSFPNLNFGNAATLYIN